MTKEKMEISPEAKAYLAKIGAKGGRKTGPTKVRSSEEMARRVRMRWDRVRAEKATHVARNA